MEKNNRQIEIVIRDITTIQNQFNPEELSEEFGNYLYRHCAGNPFRGKITLRVKENILSKKEQNHFCDMIHAYFGREVQENMLFLEHNQWKQIFLFLLGVLLIIVSYWFRKFTEVLFSELFMIAGWVVIWEFVYSYIFTETKRKLKIKRLRQLSECKIQFEKDNS